MESKAKILTAAARVYAEHGFRGATTRRIAEAAGVNEVTLFRHFKSKEALLAQALRLPHDSSSLPRLPDEPVDPPAELLDWVTAQHKLLCDQRSLMRKAMSEMEERPSFCAGPREGAMIAAGALRRYLDRLADRGWLEPGHPDAPAAPAMLIGALFADAMGRDMMPEFYRPLAAARQSYTRLFLRAIGLRPRPKSAPRAAGNGNGRRHPRTSKSR